jgi:ketosteroid isomerase-like protein
MMALWAPNATFTVKPGDTRAGKKEIRRFWLDAPVFQPENHWVSETPAYKLRVTVNGDRGTLYFECHYVDAKTGKVVAVTAADEQVARINGRWLITNNVGASPILSP